MNDIVLSRSDRDKLINSVVELFPDNQSADGLLKLLNFPRRRRPMFEEHPEKAWREVFAEFDDRTTSGTPYRELLAAIALVFPDHHALVAIAVRYEAEIDPTAPRHRVLVVGAGDGPERSRELQKIYEARDSRYVDVDCCPGQLFDAEAVVRVRPQILHLCGRCDGDRIHFMDGPVPAEEIARRLDRCFTDYGVRLDGLIINAGHSEPLMEVFAPVADIVVAHRADLDDEQSIRFAGMLYQVLPAAPTIGAAATAAQLFVLQKARPASASNSVVLDWNVRPRPERASRSGGDVFRSAARPSSPEQQDITLSRVDLVDLEEQVALLYQDGPDIRRLLLRIGLPADRRPNFSNPHEGWAAVFAALEVGAVAGSPYRDILTETSGRYERNAVLQRLASKYLRRGTESA